MRNLLKINIILITVLITGLSILNFSYEYTITNFRGGDYFVIQESGTVSKIKDDLETLSKQNDVYVYTEIQAGKNQQTAVSNPQKLFSSDFDGGSYFSNCAKCENSQMKIGEINAPRYRFNNYVYSLDEVDNFEISKTTFSIKGNKKNVETFISDLTQKYEVNEPDLTYQAPDYKSIKHLIAIILISLYILYSLLLIRDVKEISILKLNGVSATEIYRKRTEKEVFQVICIWAIFELATIIGHIFYQPTVILALIRHQTIYGGYYFSIILIIYLSHLSIFKLGCYENFIGKNYFSDQMVKILAILRVVVLLITIFLVLVIGFLLKPTLNLFEATKYYEKYNDYSVAIFNSNELEGEDQADVNEFASKLYNATVDEFDGIWIDNTKIIYSENCNEEKSNFDQCGSIMANGNYVEGEGIVDENGQAISEKLTNKKNTVIVPICKKDMFDEYDEETLNGVYDNVIYAQCGQQYHLFSSDLTTEQSFIIEDPVVYVVKKGDKKIASSIKFNNGYFINASEEEYMKIINAIDGDKYILRAYPKINDFDESYSAARNILFLRAMELIIIISCIVNVILLEIMIYSEVTGQEIRRKISVGYSISRIFKMRMITNVIVMVISLLLAIATSIYFKSYTLLYLMLLWIGFYAILEWRLLLNYKVWRKNE